MTSKKLPAFYHVIKKSQGKDAIQPEGTKNYSGTKGMDSIANIMRHQHDDITGSTKFKEQPVKPLVVEMPGVMKKLTDPVTEHGTNNHANIERQVRSKIFLP
jgi:hypothetical protein